MSTFTDPIAYLRRMRRAGSHNDVEQMIRDRDSVLARFGPRFSDPSRLDADTLADFLGFEHNRHWWGLQRHADLLVSRIESVRRAMVELLDEATPLAVRVDGIGDVAGYPPEVWSPMLLMARPSVYGVWSPISESAMTRLGLWVDTAGGVGATYARVNEMLAAVATELDVDRWTLDALWWGVEKEHDPSKHFVTRARPTPKRSPAPRQSVTRQTARRRSQNAVSAAGAETFVCGNCWTTKPTRLMGEVAGRCVDCS